MAEKKRRFQPSLRDLMAIPSDPGVQTPGYFSRRGGIPAGRSFFGCPKIELRPRPTRHLFSLVVQSEFFYSGFTVVTKSVEAPDESCLACARRGAAVSDRIDLTPIELAEKL